MYNVTIRFLSGDVLVAQVTAERFRSMVLTACRGASIKAIKVRS
jgi:hypothetical protein